ncbi:MAG: L-lactate dehydrogenase, partial [Trichococcus flocculiformis]
AVINRSGIRNIIEIPLSDAEQEKMDLSATTLKKVLEEGFASLEADAK